MKGYTVCRERDRQGKTGKKKLFQEPRDAKFRRQRERQSAGANSSEIVKGQAIDRREGTDDKTQVSIRQCQLLSFHCSSLGGGQTHFRVTVPCILHIFGKHSQDPVTVAENHLGK